MHSLFSFFNALIPWSRIAVTLYLLSAAVLIIAAWRVWQAPVSVSLRYAFLLLATVLVSPHLNVYDLVILAPALLLIADWAVCHPLHPAARRVQQLLYFSYALPLAGVATRYTHVQLSVVAMSGLVWAVGPIVLTPFRAQENTRVPAPARAP